MVRGHKSSRLALDDLLLHHHLFLLTQPGYVTTVNATGVSTLELRQQANILVIRFNVHSAEDTLFFLRLEGILNVDRCITFR